MKNRLVSRWITVLVILLTLILLTGCGEDNPLIGTWTEPESGISIQFKDDGNVVMSNSTTSITLPYETQDPNTIIIKASEDGVTPDQTMTYRVEEDKLILIVDGVESVFSKQD